MDGRYAIEATDISFSYASEAPTLRGLSLHARKGEFACILGHSGCGKSTLLSLIMGLIEPASGSIRIDGEPMRGPETDRAIVFQDYSLFPWMTARQNVAFGIRHSRGAAKQEALALADDYLAQVGLYESRDKYPHQLSGGMQQRVGIARAFVSKPRVIFADEPTGNLDSITSKQVLYRMLQISKQMGTTFVMVTHEPELASCADRIITILDGKVQSDVVQDPATRERNRESLFSSLEGNMRIGGDSASGEVHQKTAAELASYAAPAAAAQQPEQPKP